MRPFPRVLQQAPVPQLVLLFFCTLYFPFQILSEGREHRGWTGTTSVDLCCDALLHNKICCNLHMVYLRETRGRFDGDPTVRQRGSSTRASTTSTGPRKQGLFKKIHTIHSMCMMPMDR